MLPMNLLSHLTRTFSLAIRLFGNMLSHQIIVAVLLVVLPLVVPAVLEVFGLFIGVLQAYIFTILTVVYIAGAVRAEGEAALISESWFHVAVVAHGRGRDRRRRHHAGRRPGDRRARRHARRSRASRTRRDDQPQPVRCAGDDRVAGPVRADRGAGAAIREPAGERREPRRGGGQGAVLVRHRLRDRGRPDDHLGTMLAAVGQGRVAASAMQAIAEQPDARDSISTTLYISLALLESLALYSLIVALILLFANPLTSTVLP